MTDRSLESLARGLLSMDHPAAAPRARCLCCGENVALPHACPRPEAMGAASYTVHAPDPDLAGVALGDRGPAMWTGSGFLHILDPRPEEIHLEDIARNLSRIPRFGGATDPKRPAWSVAEHSVLCARLAARLGHGPAVERAALMHDAAEAYLGDVVRPLKSVLPEFCRIEGRLLRVIADRFGLAWSSLTAPAVKEIDNLACATEAAALLPGAPEFPGLPTPAEITITPAGADFARGAFLARCRGLALA